MESPAKPSLWSLERPALLRFMPSRSASSERLPVRLVWMINQ